MSGPPPTGFGRSPYDIVSALQKAIRRSQPEQAAGFALELAQSPNGNWLWKRLRVIAVEDCSPQATGLVADIDALHAQWKASRGEDLLTVARAAVALALAPKSRVANYLVLLNSAENAAPVEIPDEAYDWHTRRGKQMGRGREHFDTEASRLIDWEGDLREWGGRSARQGAGRLACRPEGLRNIPASDDPVVSGQVALDVEGEPR